MMNFTKRISCFVLRSNKPFKRNSVRAYGIAAEKYQKTSFTFLTDETDDVIYIEKFSPVGFRLMNGFQVLGPAVFFPRSVLGWKVKNSTDINENSLSLFPLLAPKLDLLIVGIGDPGSQFDMNIIRYLRSNKISMEILPTEQAIPTYNFLNSEKRNVAAALIPPATLDMPSLSDELVANNADMSVNEYDLPSTNTDLDKVFEEANPEIYKKIKSALHKPKEKK